MKFRSKIAIAISAFLCAVLFLWFWTDESLQDRLPSPNGYEALLQAAQAIEGYRGSYQDMGPEQSTRFIEANQETLEKPRQGLEKECRIPIGASSAWFNTHQREMAQLKSLVHTIITEGKVAEARGQSQRALDIYLDGLTLSHKAVGGGLSFDYLCGVSFQALVLRAIEDLIPQLKPEQSRQALLVLEKLEDEQESLKSIVRRNKVFRRKTFGPVQSIQERIAAMVRTWSLNPELFRLRQSAATLDQQSDRLRKKLAPLAGASDGPG